MSIPFTFHFIWVGENPLPDQFEHYLETWKRYHPRATFRVWNNTDREIMAASRVPLLDQVKNPCQQADIMRYQILYNHGGIYCDFDMECLKSIEPLLLPNHDLIVCNETNEENVPYMSNSWIAARKNHPVFKCILDRLRDKDYQALIGKRGINETTGPYLFGWGLAQHHGGVLRLPKNYFYPFLWYEKEKDNVHGSGDTFAIHHWAGSWKK